MIKKQRVIITGPALKDPGGVASYYNAVLPFLNKTDKFDIEYVEIGSTAGRDTNLHFFIDQVRIWKLLKTNTPDLLHINPSMVFRSFIRDGFFIWLARRRLIPVMVFFHGWESSFEGKIKYFLKYYFDFTYKRANFFFVLASTFRDKLLSWGVRSPVVLTTTAVNEQLLKNFDFEKKMMSVERGDLIKILFMARLEYKKGVLDVLDAVLNMLKAGSRISLTIAGDGPAMKDIKDILENNIEQKKNIYIEGYVRGNEKSELLKTHHIFCFPTEYAEGMPISVLEAIVFGMPIITCAVGGLVDFFVNGKMGYMSETRDTDTIRSAIQELLDNRKKLTEMGRYNYKYGQEHFLASGAAKNLLEAYHAITISD